MIFRSGPRMFAAGLVLLLTMTACGSETAPEFDHEIRVETMRFFPNTILINAGDKVRWVNVIRKSAASKRTVTSGTGPDDPNSGDLFDVELDGFDSGEPQGDSFIMQFDDVGFVEYYTRFPVGEEYTASITIQ